MHPNRQIWFFGTKSADFESKLKPWSGAAYHDKIYYLYFKIEAWVVEAGQLVQTTTTNAPAIRGTYC